MWYRWTGWQLGPCKHGCRKESPCRTPSADCSTKSPNCSIGYADWFSTARMPATPEAYLHGNFFRNWIWSRHSSSTFLESIFTNTYAGIMMAISSDTRFSRVMNSSILEHSLLAGSARSQPSTFRLSTVMLNINWSADYEDDWNRCRTVEAINCTLCIRWLYIYIGGDYYTHRHSVSCKYY